MVSVPRELLERAVKAGGAGVNAVELVDAWRAVAELKDLLDAPAEDVREVVEEPEIVAIVESALRRSFTLGQLYWQQADSDSTRQQNKSDQTMEIQSNHITMVVKSIKSLIK
jgi:hypothetical protein